VVRFPAEETFLFSIHFRPALGLTQPCIQRVPGALSLGVKRQGREADHSSPSNKEFKNGGVTLHSLISFHSMILKYIIKYKVNFAFEGAIKVIIGIYSSYI
jgi:hypothetical protein